ASKWLRLAPLELMSYSRRSQTSFLEDVSVYLAQKLTGSDSQYRDLSCELSQRIRFSTLVPFVFAVPTYAAERLTGRYLEVLANQPRIQDCNILLFVNATDEISNLEFQRSLNYNRQIARFYNEKMGRIFISVQGARLPGGISMGRVR